MKATRALGSVPDREIVLRWAQDLYRNSVDQKDAAGFAAVFTPAAFLRFGNSAPITGRAEIEAAIAYFFSTFAALRHESRGTWLVEQTLILEAIVTYTRHDAGEVTIPAITIFELARASDRDAQEPLAEECRIFVDLAPLYAPTSTVGS